MTEQPTLDRWYTWGVYISGGGLDGFDYWTSTHRPSVEARRNEVVKERPFARVTIRPFRLTFPRW